MQRGSALLVSAAAHVVVVGAIAWFVVPGEDRDARAAETVAVAPEESLVEVDLVEVPGTPPRPLTTVAPARIETAQPPASTATAAATEHRHATAGAGGTTESAALTAAGAMGLGGGSIAGGQDGGHAPDGGGTAPPGQLAFDGSVLDKIANNYKMPAPTEISGRVQDSGGGTARIDDAVTTVTIGNDGEAHFHDKPAIEVHFLPGVKSFSHIGKEIGDDLEDWYRHPDRDRTKAGRTQDQPEHELAIQGACDSFGSCDANRGEGSRMDNGTIPLIGGKFEINDFLMRKLHIGDPYLARKAAILASTFDERAERGARHSKEALDHSTEIMRGNLDTLWRTTADPAARREGLFELWDECAEGDDSAGKAGARARAEVIGWIRSRLPVGSAGAFGDAEIAKLSGHRTSKQPFVPYEVVADAPATATEPATQPTE